MNESTKVSLYDIHDAKDFIERFGSEELDVAELSKAVEIQEQNKVNAIVAFSQELKLTAEAAKAESDRLKEIADGYEKKSERVKAVIQYSMEAHGIDRIETEKFKISFRKSESVEVDDVEQLPEQFVVIKKSADKKAIKEAIKSGETLAGARIVAKNNLQVK